MFYEVLVCLFGKTVPVSPCFQKLNKVLPAVPKSPDGSLSYRLTLQCLLTFTDGLVNLYECRGGLVLVLVLLFEIFCRNVVLFS